MSAVAPEHRITTSKTGFTAYMKLLEQHVHEARSKNEKLALLLIELSNLREFNTSLGYECGRQILSVVAQRLQSLCRVRDRVVQYSDQGFAVILPGVRNDGHATLAVTKALRLLEEPIRVAGTPVTVSSAIGVSLFPEHGGTGLQLMQNTEIALASAHNAKDDFHFFSAERTVEVTGLIGLAQELDTAMAAGDLEMHFQPMLDLFTGVPCGAEALMRWQHAQRGFISPELFIDIADRGGQIYDLTWFALNTALRKLREWQVGETFTVSVNATPNIVQHRDLLDIVANALQVWGVPARQLMLEVTESALMTDPEASFRNLHSLRELGVQIAIDDFGTGYSSLSYFKNIPATELKIDKSFVLNMQESREDRQIVQSVISLAHCFGLRVVAEGIENEYSENVLREWECDIAQGYYYSRPLPAPAIKDWLADRADQTRAPA